MDRIADDVWIDIFCFLPTKEFLQIGYLCKHFHKLTDSKVGTINTYWYNQSISKWQSCFKNYSSKIANSISKSNPNSNQWFLFYKELHLLMINLLMNLAPDETASISSIDFLFRLIFLHDYIRIFKMLISTDKDEKQNLDSVDDSHDYLNGDLNDYNLDDVDKYFGLSQTSQGSYCGENIQHHARYRRWDSDRLNQYKLGSGSIIQTCCCYNSIKILEYLINEFGMDDIESHYINNKDTLSKDSFSHHPLVIAAKRGHFDIIGLLAKNGWNLNHSNHNRDTLLHIICSCMRFNVNVIDVLIKHGANPNVRNNGFSTPVIMAAYSNAVDAMTVLMDACEKYSTKDNEIYIDFDARDSDDHSPLMIAALCGNIKMIKNIFEKYEKELKTCGKHNNNDNNNDNNNQLSKTCNAIGNGIMAINNKGETAFSLAVEYGRNNIVKRIYKFMIDQNKHELQNKQQHDREGLWTKENINKYMNQTRVSNGQTAYILACKQGNGTIKLFLENTCKVDVRIIDDQYKTGNVHWIEHQAKEENSIKKRESSKHKDAQVMTSIANTNVNRDTGWRARLFRKWHGAS